MDVSAMQFFLKSMYSTTVYNEKGESYTDYGQNDREPESKEMELVTLELQQGDLFAPVSPRR